MYYGSEEPALRNAEPDGFQALYSPMKIWRLPIVGELRWHSVQWRLVDGYSADAVVLSSNSRNISYWFALVRAKFKRVPVAVWGHGYSKLGANTLRDWLRVLPMRLADVVIFYDARTAQAFIDAGFDERKIVVAHNGLDSKSIAHTRDLSLERLGGKAAAKSVSGLGQGPVLIYVGRLLPENKLDVLIDAMPALREKYPDVKVVIVGGGDTHKSDLQSQADALEVGESFIWAGPIYTEDELAPWMIAADAFVFPSNVGLSLVHAFNYALPAVICAPLSAHNPEAVLVEDGVNTVIASELSAPALSAALENMLDSAERCEQMGRQAYSLVQDKHNVSGMVRGFLTVFDKFRG